MVSDCTDHEQRHEHKHAVHHNIQGGAERVVLVVEQAVVEHFLEARDVLGRTEERLVQLGGVPAEGVHDDPKERRTVGKFAPIDFWKGNGITKTRTLPLDSPLVVTHGRLPVLVDRLDVIGNVVHPVVKREPLQSLLVQADRRVAQYPPLVVAQELGRAVAPRGERVARDAQEDVQLGERRAGRVREVVLRRVLGEVVADDLLHVEALLRERDGRRAGEDLRPVLPEVVDYALDAAGVLVDEVLDVVYRPVDDDPVLPGLEPDVLHAEDSVLLTEQQGHETEDTDEKRRARDHGDEESDLLAPRLLGVLRRPRDALVGYEERQDPREAGPDPALCDLPPVPLRELRLRHARRVEATVSPVMIVDCAPRLSDAHEKRALGMMAAELARDRDDCVDGAIPVGFRSCMNLLRAAHVGILLRAAHVRVLLASAGVRSVHLRPNEEENESVRTDPRRTKHKEEAEIHLASHLASRQAPVGARVRPHRTPHEGAVREARPSVLRGHRALPRRRLAPVRVLAPAALPLARGVPRGVPRVLPAPHGRAPAGGCVLGGRAGRVLRRHGVADRIGPAGGGAAPSPHGPGGVRREFLAELIPDVPV
ncbi:hypothetical protein THAOC_02592 [Thalassiosira oceanica]|uniref:Uncharacterized protein n=1 Tax=Thalassiosira oceanica TaxID=159749 RepID=K0TAH2_THAOC|nr:hypothetical protein THAOC_02592 [Thalassiosira oceanica]|eukprot:EJK75683.1 hypothetical protein THAOC_02592 [Thalassiosira oceanica]